MFTDTLATTRRLEQAGFDLRQAEALAQEHERMAQEIVRHIQAAFAPQFAEIKAELKAEMKAMEHRLETRIESVARDQLFKIVALFLSTGGLVLAGVAFIVSRLM